MSARRIGRVVGVVLAGGASVRMGRDKATLVIGGEGLAARAARRLARVTSEVVVADRGRGVVAGAVSVADAPFGGPAAALLGAAERFPRRSLLALACDLPSVPVSLLAHLARAHPEADLVLPRHGPERRLEPLCARWGPRALDLLRTRAEAGKRSLYPLADRPELRVQHLSDAVLGRFGEPATMLLNVNEAADLARLGGS